MDLGAFSVSLTVKDLQASRAFYETLGFTPFAGDGTHWQILRNREHVIGLFQGVFDRDILTLNPGWDQNGRPVTGSTDRRERRRRPRAAGSAFAAEAAAESSGPAR